MYGQFELINFFTIAFAKAILANYPLPLEEKISKTMGKKDFIKRKNSGGMWCTLIYAHVPGGFHIHKREATRGSL